MVQVIARKHLGLSIKLDHISLQLADKLGARLASKQF